MDRDESGERVIERGGRGEEVERRMGGGPNKSESASQPASQRPLSSPLLFSSLSSLLLSSPLHFSPLHLGAVRLTPHFHKLANELEKFINLEQQQQRRDTNLGLSHDTTPRNTTTTKYNTTKHNTPNEHKDTQHLYYCNVTHKNTTKHTETFITTQQTPQHKATRPIKTTIHYGINTTPTYIKATLNRTLYTSISRHNTTQQNTTDKGESKQH